MRPTQYVPHVDLLLESLRISKQRLNSKSKIVIDTELLRAILQSVARSLPFSAEFYASTYPDIAEAAASGSIPNLRRHYAETGYLEGRIGAPPRVDEAFYLATYPDVQEAIDRGDVASATEHYIQSGAAEGRVPLPALQEEIDHWTRLLHPARALNG